MRLGRGGPGPAGVGPAVLGPGRRRRPAQRSTATCWPRPRAADCAVLVVDDGRAARDWPALGAARVLAPALHPRRAGHRPRRLRPHHPAGRRARRRPARPARRRRRGGARWSPSPAPAAPACPPRPWPWPRPWATTCAPPGWCCWPTSASTPSWPCSTTSATWRPASRSWSRPTGRASRPSTPPASLAWVVDERRYHLLLGSAPAPVLAGPAAAGVRGRLRHPAPGLPAWSCATSTPTSRARTAAGRSTSRSATSWPAPPRRGPTWCSPSGSPSLKGVHALVRVITDLVGLRRRPPTASCPCSTGRPARRGPGPPWARPWPSWPPPSPAAAWPSPSTCPSATSTSDLHDGRRLPPVLGAPLAGALHAVLERVGRAPARRSSGRRRAGAARLARAPGRGDEAAV